MGKILHKFQPDWEYEVVPGDSILERMGDLKLSKANFAINMGYSPKHIHKIIEGEATINEDTALRLEKVLDIPANFWMNLESNYRQALAKEKERKNLRQQTEWLKQLPLKDMIKFHWVDKFSDQGQQIQECLKFYGVASIKAWHNTQNKNFQAVFKSSDKFSKDDISIQTWLRQGEREAQKISCDSFNKARLENTLDQLRQLTLLENPDNFIPELTKLCASCGIAVVFTPTPEQCPMSGATKWLSKDKVLLLLSLRHKTNDHLWFAFFHEIAHILKHRKILFLNGNVGSDQTLKEEADKFSADVLIPKIHQCNLPSLQTQKSIIDFSKKIQISPGIVVGRLQHQRILSWGHFNNLKVKYRWHN
jgi:addiction module HigA family antidote